MDATRVAARALAGYASGNAVGDAGDEAGLQRVRRAVEELCGEDNSVCLVCIGTISHAEAVWNCGTCAALFHLPCIQAWIRDGVAPPSLLSPELFPAQQRKWHCPKCRCEYNVSQAPTKYLCFCGKEENPRFDPWLTPHSCGTPCGRKLKAACGHTCAMLCHPGPCPPCPRQVEGRCPCGRVATARRCGQPARTCGAICGRSLTCAAHKCSAQCHSGDCTPCELQVSKRCVCGAATQTVSCGQIWQCEKVCGKSLPCGHHRCEQVCHSGGCGECPRAQRRTCPCGKNVSQLPCTEDVPSCGDTCSRLLPCGLHRCVRRCHQGHCDPCMQEVDKLCRCGQSKKRMPCSKPLLCERRCEAPRQCGRHACRRKCCTGRDCPPCEEACGRKSQCQNHKCQSPCHSGPCYPCPLTVTLACACGASTVTLPCGRERKAKLPHCVLPCQRPSACHHATQVPHPCHAGPCPPCKQPCGQPQPCNHPCPALCHDPPPESLQPVRGRKASTLTVPSTGLAAAILTAPAAVAVPLACPPCSVRVAVRCVGDHQTKSVACHSSAAPYHCGQPCGRMLTCGAHPCAQTCHIPAEGCGECTAPCSRPQPAGCTHACPRICHAGFCDDCGELLRVPCHCGALTMHPLCCEYLAASSAVRETSLSCRGSCPKMLSCGHPCALSCHSGPCSSPTQCRKKLMVRCPCKRRRAEHQCRESAPVLECDADCRTALDEMEKTRQAEEARRAEDSKRREEEENVKLLAMIQGGRKKKRRVRTETDTAELTLLERLRDNVVAVAAGVAITAVVVALAVWGFA